MLLSPIKKCYFASIMEALITIVGFLGAGKTTLLKQLLNRCIEEGRVPFVILNDYENASLDARQLTRRLDAKNVMALSGSCICCSGIEELRDYVNSIPKRDKGITLIEANGTSDACTLNGFLGVGLKAHFLPPVQVSVVDVKNWQRRKSYNELEANQVQVSSLIVLTHTDKVKPKREAAVIENLKMLNPSAEIMRMEHIDLLPKLMPSKNKAQKLDHHKAHWASCSADLPWLPGTNSIDYICKNLPKSILRVKGCTQVGSDEHYTYFARTPDGEVSIKPFYGVPTTGAKLLAVGPGSEVALLENVVRKSIAEINR